MSFVVMYLKERGRSKKKVRKDLWQLASPDLWQEAPIDHDTCLYRNPSLYYVNIFSV